MQLGLDAVGCTLRVCADRALAHVNAGKARQQCAHQQCNARHRQPDATVALRDGAAAARHQAA